MKLRYTPDADNDLASIFDYLSAESPRSAQKQIARIFMALEKLPRMPRMAREGRVAGTRELVVTRTPYVVVYSIDDAILILRVLHGRQQWPLKEGDLSS